MKRAWGFVACACTAACGAILGLPDRVDDPELVAGPDAFVDSPVLDSAGPVTPSELTSLTVSPANATVLGGATQQFTATGTDAMGRTPSPLPAFTWSVSGGGSMSATGLFTAGAATGGPFTVTAQSGSLTATATVSIKASTFTIGETKILETDDSGNAGLLLAQAATLARAATVTSLSFYVAMAAGKLRLGIYDGTGPQGRAGALKAETNELTTVVGWNTANVVTPVSLTAGEYWLAYAPSDSNLHFRKTNSGNVEHVYFPITYGPLPAMFSTTPTINQGPWSFYATMTP